MADRNTNNLCVQIVHAHFGPLTAKVASALLTRGRLTLPQIVRFTALRPRTARAAVLILVQHNLAWHSQSEEDGEMIEFNTEECLLRLRFGTFVWQADQLFGSAAAEIVSLVLDHGKLRPPDIRSHFSSPKSKGKDASIYYQALYQLVSSSYLVPSTVLFHVSPRDKFLQYEKEEKNQIKSFPTAKELKEAKERAAARLKREQEDAMKIGLTKRGSAKINGTKLGKRKAMDDEVVDDDVYFRVNATKFNIHIRSKLIQTAVRERYNESTTTVMRAILKSAEAKATMSDVRSDSVSIATIASHIPDEQDITAGLAYSSTKKPSMMSALKEYLGILASADNPTPAGRAASFISFAGVSSGKVYVEYEIICRRLRRRVLEAVARERYGDEAVRVVRLLLENGKMSGDQIAKAAMMAVTAIRPLLSLLSAESLISIQEVPKGADRNPQRTIYLWYVDLPKAYSVLLGKFYKTLYNIGMRKRAESEDATVRAVLEKSERSDVRADPSLLTRMEREVLQSWEERRDKLTVLEMRVEEAVFILRDLSLHGVEDE
ncbi:uncharacterized protein FOMMEDRAFT_103906 [Fomitiporia mediterranea MF3/22]|uniref:uncharacterized protein n=1 Tax=Fomitiporia mediterranea (strain MF3/22) TaxID=694068 RepID=UPI0004408792|nr:uncharacterized protein FOMMEDRAFT_103906 [Fomitiporia mediterranea MF3/22]EJD05716.1 hypothetical protein FOMMEDRAFT_103906 [Fomitiporia mediterranea MF3/22]